MRFNPADALKRRYEAELEFRRTRGRKGDPHGNDCAAMITASLLLDAGELPAGTDRGTWIWSDLHLDQWDAPAVFGRPFGTSDEMDAELLSAWNRTVDGGDVVICLGDVGFKNNSGAAAERLDGAPGWKILVIGNHDCGPGYLTDAHWADGIHPVLYAPGDPPLCMTHLPLLNVPEGCINIHGHTHGAPAAPQGPRINVCVEHLEYRPAPLQDIRRLAAEFAAGRSVHGTTTAEQLRALPPIG